MGRLVMMGCEEFRCEVSLHRACCFMVCRQRCVRGAAASMIKNALCSCAKSAFHLHCRMVLVINGNFLEQSFNRSLLESQSPPRQSIIVAN